MEDREKETQENSITLIDYAIILLKHKRLIFAITAAGTVLTVIITLLLPVIYRAETSVLASSENGSSLSLQIVGQLGIPLPGGLLEGKNTNDVYVKLLRSKTVLDKVIERFNLMSVYKKKYIEDARDVLLKSLSIDNDRKSGVITIGVEDRDPQRAADIANGFVEELKGINNRLAVTEAAKRRLFFEDQLVEIKNDLVGAEDSMVGYQEKTGAIEIKEQAKAVIESIAKLRAEIAAKEVELKVLRTYTTQRNPDLQKIQDELQGMKEQLAKLEGNEGAGADPLMPTGKMPAAGTGYFRRLRDLKFYETLYELMSKQYEMAKIDEAREAGVIQVVDMASPPNKKVKPRRIFFIGLFGITSFIAAIIAAFFVEYKEIISLHPEKRAKVEQLKKYIPFKK